MRDFARQGDVMPIQIKDAATIAKKWATRAAAASADYTSGVKDTSVDQAGAAAAAAPVWAQAVSDAAARNAFAKGVTAAGTQKWKDKASTVGSQRYGQGVTAAQNDYAAKVSPFLSVLASVNLPPRNVKGNNIGRVQAVVDALRKAKLAS